MLAAVGAAVGHPNLADTLPPTLWLQPNWTAAGAVASVIGPSLQVAVALYVWPPGAQACVWLRQPDGSTFDPACAAAPSARNPIPFNLDIDGAGRSGTWLLQAGMVRGTAVDSTPDHHGVTMPLTLQAAHASTSGCVRRRRRPPPWAPGVARFPSAGGLVAGQSTTRWPFHCHPPKEFIMQWSLAPPWRLLGARHMRSGVLLRTPWRSVADAVRLLTDEHVVFVGDSILRYSAFGLMQALSQRRWLPHNLTGVPHITYVHDRPPGVAWGQHFADVMERGQGRGQVHQLLPGAPRGRGIDVYHDPGARVTITQGATKTHLWLNAEVTIVPCVPQRRFGTKPPCLWTTFG